MEATSALEVPDVAALVQMDAFTLDNDLDTLFVMWATTLVLFMQVPFSAMGSLLPAVLREYAPCCVAAVFRLRRAGEDYSATAVSIPFARASQPACYGKLQLSISLRSKRLAYVWGTVQARNSFVTHRTAWVLCQRNRTALGVLRISPVVCTLLA